MYIYVIGTLSCKSAFFSNTSGDVGLLPGHQGGDCVRYFRYQGTFPRTSWTSASSVGKSSTL